MKKIAVLVSVMALACFMLLVSFATTFSDVPDDAYYADAANRMADKGILSGFGDGRFYGDFELTRAQFAALACKMLGKADEAAALAGKTNFVDVPETHWSTGYVNYAVANKIIVGDGDGNFRPDDSVKYEEAIKVIICVINPDNNIKVDPTDWSKNYLEEADKLGLTNNLIGKKGEALKRSDIAVLADKGMSIMDTLDEEETTTTRRSGGVVKPSQSTTTASPEETKGPVVVTLPTAETSASTAPDDELDYTRAENELEEF